MKTKRIEIGNAYIDCIYNNEGIKRSALLVIPGGGYGIVCSDREGYPIAEAFMPYEFNCFVLNYSVGEKAKFPEPLIEASKAMQYIRENADELNIDPERVFVVGFSAGGHLSGSLGTLWHTIKEVPEGINRPTGMILGYPVSTSKAGEGHLGSFYNILGTTTPSESELAKYSLENCVDEKTCPAFIFHTGDDAVVPVMGSIRLAEALSRNKIPYEMHIFPSAPHGIALGNKITAKGNPLWVDERIAEWVRLAAGWTKTIK